MQFAFSSNAFLRFPFAEAARQIAAAGYRGIEIMADVPHAWPAYLLEVDKRALRQAVDDHHLTISNINAFMMHAIDDPRQKYWYPSWIEPDPHYRRIRVEHTKKALTLAKELGAQCITTEPGGPVLSGNTWRHALELFVQELKPVIEYAEREEVRLLVEPEPGLLIENSDQFEEFISHFDSPMLGLNFDIGHFFCVGEDPSTAYDRLKKYVGHVHIEDIAASRVHHHLVPGDGAIDMKAILRRISTSRYRGWVTVELYPYIDEPGRAATLALERLKAVSS